MIGCMERIGSWLEINSTSRSHSQRTMRVQSSDPTARIPYNIYLKIHSHATSPGHFAILLGMHGHMLSYVSSPLSSLAPCHMTRELISRSTWRSTQQGHGRGINNVKRSITDVRDAGISCKSKRAVTE